MTTDRQPPGDGPAGGAGDPDARRARLERLRERRASPGGRAGAAPGRPSRRHAARRSRILVAGLSAATALGLVGAMAGPLPSPRGPAASPVVVVRRGVGSAPAPGGQAPTVTGTAAPPVTTSQAS